MCSHRCVSLYTIPISSGHHFPLCSKPCNDFPPSSLQAKAGGSPPALWLTPPLRASPQATLAPLQRADTLPPCLCVCYPSSLECCVCIAGLVPRTVPPPFFRTNELHVDFLCRAFQITGWVSLPAPIPGYLGVLRECNVNINLS